MAFDFAKLPGPAKRAAFAHMDRPGASRALGSGKRLGDIRGQGDPAAIPAVRKANALADAYRAGHLVERDLGQGSGNSDAVLQVRLSDGTTAVYKRLLNMQSASEAKDAYLAGLVADALGIEGVTTALLSKREVVMRMAPGVTAATHRTRTGEIDAAGSRVRSGELRQMLQLRNGREIGVLDYLTGQIERHDQNFTVHEGTAYPTDQKYATFETLQADPGHTVLNSPFSQQHLHALHQVHPDDPIPPPIPTSELVSPLSSAELAHLRTRLEELRPEFVAKRASGKWAYMMQQLATLETASKEAPTMAAPLGTGDRYKALKRKAADAAKPPKKYGKPGQAPGAAARK